MPEINDLSIFGDYKHVENKVTSALLHIFEAGKEELIRHIIVDKLKKELPENKITIISQDKQEESQPDGSLKCSFKFKIFIESKIKPFEKSNEEQLRRHMKLLKEDGDILLYITTDVRIPKSLENVALWANWTQINEWLGEYSKKDRLLEFLCVNFDKFLRNKKLLTEEWNAEKNERVLIVAGCRFGEKVALKCNKYFCQNERSFRPSGFIAFYCNKQIKYCYKIIETLKKDEYLLNYDDLVEFFLENRMINSEKKIVDEKYNWIEKHSKIFELGEKITINTIEHNKKSAFTQNQRYTKINLLESAHTTNDL